MSEIKFPLTIKSINNKCSNNPCKESIFSSNKIGSFVAIRPCGEEYKNKTYLGLYLGNICLSPWIAFDPRSEELIIEDGHDNPAIFVFDLNKIIFGYESWWGEIESEEDLKDITDADINNVWYVKVLKQINDMREKE